MSAVTIRIFCPRLIRGIIHMYGNVHMASVIDSESAKRTVLNYIALGIGLAEPSQVDGEMFTTMSHTVGGNYAPEDTWPLINLIHNAFDTIYGVDCTLDYLTVVGDPTRHGTYQVHEIQNMASLAYVQTEGLETSFEMDTLNKNPYA